MERLFFREKVKQGYEFSTDGVMQDRQKFVVGVTGICAGAGATFTAMGLAFRLAEMTSGVTYIEGCPHGCRCVSPYRLLAVDRDFRRVTEKYGCGKGRLNIYKKVNWQVYKPNEGQASEPNENEPDYRQAAGRIIIVDSPLSLDDIDIEIAVVDPFPPRISAGMETFKKLRMLDKEGGMGQRKILWLINKSDGGAACRQTEKFLKLKFDFEQIMLPTEVLYKAAYSCSQPYFICKTEGINLLAAKILDTI